MKLSFQVLTGCFLLSAGSLVSAQEVSRGSPVPPPVEKNGQPVLSTDHPLANPGPPGAPKGPLVRCLNKFGMGCNAHHTWFGCGSFRSEMTFIFGSCRTFFGEPCFPKPPQEERRGGYGTGSSGLGGGTGLFGHGWRHSDATGLGLFRRALGCSSCQ